MVTFKSVILSELKDSKTPMTLLEIQAAVGVYSSQVRRDVESLRHEGKISVKRLGEKDAYVA